MRNLFSIPNNPQQGLFILLLLALALFSFDHDASTVGVYGLEQQNQRVKHIVRRQVILRKEEKKNAGLKLKLKRITSKSTGTGRNSGIGIGIGIGSRKRRLHATSTLSPSASSTLAPHHSSTLSPHHYHSSTRAPSYVTNGPSQSQSPTHSSDAPTSLPSTSPSHAPSSSQVPSSSPTSSPTAVPTVVPSTKPSSLHSVSPSSSSNPSLSPSLQHSSHPSMVPTAGPTSLPSSVPTSSPSNKPTSHPSTLPPSSAPSPASCRAVNGAYGDTSGGQDSIAVTVTFTYGIETDQQVLSVMNTKATLSEQIKNVKEELVHLLIEEFFPNCSSNRRNLNGFNIFGGSNNIKDADADSDADADADNNADVPVGNQGVIGIVSTKADLANGKKCIGHYTSNPNYEVDCNVVNGILTMYAYVSSDTDTNKASSRETELASTILKDVQLFMDKNLLRETHPATLSVIYMTESRTAVRATDGDDDDIAAELEEKEVSVVISEGPNMWMFATFGAVGALALVVGTGYRYMRHSRGGGYGYGSEEYEYREESDNLRRNKFRREESRSFVEI